MADDRREMTEAKPKVLLVDDVHANLVALDAMLDALPCELVRAGNGNEALKLLLRHEFAVMLLDVRMPGIDGFEVARYARSNPATRDTPIIFLTALDDTEESVLRGYGSGAVDFLRKPLNAHVLRAKVQVFIQLWSARQKLEREIAAHEKTLSALERANTALRHFTDAASHDLKAPVRSIRGFLHALHEDAAKQLDPSALDCLVRSMKSAERMDSLLDALLAYARLQRSLASERVACGDLIEHIRGEMREELDRCEAVLHADALPEVQGDPDRIYQLFLNVVGNALKYRRTGVAPQIRVTAETRATECLFLRGGQRHRHRSGASSADLPSIFPLGHTAPVQRQRARARHLPASSGTAQRTHLGRIAARSGLAILLHPTARLTPTSRHSDGAARTLFGK